MSNHTKISGFTLIELIVVIVIGSILLLFSFPAFRNISLFSNSTRQVGDLVRLMNDLKNRAVEHNIDFTMHLDSNSGMIWVTDESMTSEAKEVAKGKGIPILRDLIIQDVLFFKNLEKVTMEHQIMFRKQGYSDYALIHIIDNTNNITLKMEPFQSKIMVLNGHIHIEDCI